MTNTTEFHRNGPLSNIKVVDLSAVLSGPLAAGYLADQGAQVIKIESFAGDIVRQMAGDSAGVSSGFIAGNRGKKGLSVDLKTDRGVDLVKSIAASADVLIQNYRPGAVDRMGLGYEVIKDINPRLVYCSISGFGPVGPYAHKRVYDPVIQSLSGLADIQRDRDTGRPKMIRTVIPDKTTALTAAQAITAALLSRATTGEGQHVEVAMIDAMIALVWAEGMSGFTRIGDEDKPSGQPTQDLIFETSDGYLTAGAVSDSEWTGMCKALDREAWLLDERFNTASGRVKNKTERLKLTAEVIRQKPSAHWLKVMDENQVPSAPVLTRKELLTHEQIVVNELIEEFEQPGLGRVRQARPAARFSATPAGIQGVAPRRGEHTREVLADHGLSVSEIDELFKLDVVR